MKRTITLVAAILMLALCITGCATTTQQKDVKAKLSDTLQTLKDKMVDEGYIPKKDVTNTEMSPVKQKGTDGKENEYGGYLSIGAVEGVRYAFKYNNSDVNVELYRYDSKKNTDLSKKIIDEVKNHGYFTYEGTDEKVDAALSADDNSYLSIRTLVQKRRMKIKRQMLKSSSKNTKQNNLLNLLMFVALRGFSFTMLIIVLLIC